MNYFIPTYGKAENIPTLNVLHEYGIYDNIYLVVGEDDPKLDEYLQRKDCNVLVFNKQDYTNRVDSIGAYNITHKVCTYARVFIDDYAHEHNLRYICLLFDDIQSVQLRYVLNEKVYSTHKFDLISLMESYVELLNSNEHIYYVGPPGSSFYIGVNPDSQYQVPTHYANMLIYDTTKPIGPYKASVMEDMYIVLANSQIGHIGLYPFGFQVNCRQAMATGDAYVGIGKSEWVQQVAMLTGKTISYDKPQIPYSKFIPKIISSKYKKE